MANAIDILALFSSGQRPIQIGRSFRGSFDELPNVIYYAYEVPRTVGRI
jgi:hypothetical protein